MEIHGLLRLAVQRSASDLHLKVPSKPVLRIHGELLPLEEYPQLTDDHTKQMLEDITTDVQRETFYDKWELDFSYSLENAGRFKRK